MRPVKPTWAAASSGSSVATRHGAWVGQRPQPGEQSVGQGRDLQHGPPREFRAKAMYEAR